MGGHASATALLSSASMVSDTDNKNVIWVFLVVLPAAFSAALNMLNCFSRFTLPPSLFLLYLFARVFPWVPVAVEKRK